MGVLCPDGKESYTQKRKWTRSLINLTKRNNSFLNPVMLGFSHEKNRPHDTGTDYLPRVTSMV